MIRKVLSWTPVVFVAFFFFVTAASPRFMGEIGQIVDSSISTDATVTSCYPYRDGRRQQNVIRCSFDYTAMGKNYKGQDDAWSSQSPFLSADGLKQELAIQSARTSRTVTFSHRHPANASLIDDRWLAMPALWNWELVFFAASISLFFTLTPGRTVYKRATLIVDPETGELVETEGAEKIRKAHQTRWAIFAGGVVLLAELACLFNLSNRPQNALLKMSLTGLQEVPVRLVDCKHTRLSSYKGHDQIDCAFEYKVDGQVMRGQAESINFRFFPTEARLNGEVSKLADASDVTAYVDTHNPGYAVAFINDDWWAIFSWGILELEICVVMLGGLPFVMYKIISGARRDP